MNKYKAVKGMSWSTFTLYGVEQKPVIVGEDELKTADGKALPKAVIDLFVGSGNLIPCDDDGNPLESK